MHSFKTLTILLVALLLTAVSANAEKKTYQVIPGGENEVVFVSKAVGETFDGRTDHIEGEFSCDPDDLSQPVSGTLSIDVRTLDTGIKLRNNHMLENHLHPEKYPKMTFELQELVDAPSKLNTGEEHKFKARGQFTCHGVTNEIEPTLSVTRSSDGSLDITADWIVALEDYDIDRPQFLFVKLAPEQEVSATFIALPK